MTDPTPTDPTPTDPAPTDPAPTDPSPTDPSPATGGIESLPDWAQVEVRRLRAEAAGSRVKAKETAAEEARKQLIGELGKALGLGQDAPVDPEKLKADLEKTTKERRSTLVELAVVRNAGKAGADHEALLDSRAFLDRVAKLDPSDDGFAAQVAHEIADAVKKNPRFAAGTPATRSSAEIKGGASGKSTDDDSWEATEKLVERSRRRR
jgi:hypothetical protein